MKHFYLNTFFFLFFIGSISLIAQTTNNLSIQGVLDLHGSGNDLYGGYDGKAIHLVANTDITDLSIFSLSVANNGGGSDGPEYPLSGSASADDDILIY